jgi:hypothetical protein
MKITHKKPEVRFDFMKESNGREIMHWLGTPCYVKSRSKLFRNRVTIVTYEGSIFRCVPVRDLEAMDLIDLSFM